MRADDDLDEVMRRLAPPVTVSSERAARVMQGVMARLDPPEPAARPGRWLPRLLPLSRFALPVAAAALLGVVVGRDLRADTEAVALGRALVTTYYTELGY